MAKFIGGHTVINGLGDFTIHKTPDTLVVVAGFNAEVG